MQRPLGNYTHARSVQQVLNLVRERLGAAGAQLGRKVELEGQEIVEFIAASKGREDMVGQVHSCDVDW